MARPDRRQLIAGAAALAILSLAILSLAILSLGSRRVAAQNRPPKLGFAIVGLGNYAVNQIMPQFANCKHSRFTALVSGTPAKLERFGGQYGILKTHHYN